MSKHSLKIPVIECTNQAPQLFTREGIPLVLLGGELHNSSAASTTDIQLKLAHLKKLHLNAVLAPISWELVEPEEGMFDFTLVDALVETARHNDLHLVPLWFGTLKNAMSCYTPRWVKTDGDRFPRAQRVPGLNTGAISVFYDEIVHCDARAFAAVMSHLRQLDAEVGTVPMVQVENETGMLGAPRDHSPAAKAAFADSAAEQLTDYLSQSCQGAGRYLAELWEKNGRRTQGIWTEVFGRGADEVFMAWHMSRFVDAVAAAGRAEYDLPLFANAWLQKGPGYNAGDYPSGGPVATLLDVWKTGAPNLDLLAPDIYQENFREHCADYHRPDNPLLIPEARNDARAAATVLYAIGKHQAIGFAPFAIDDCPADHPLVEVYAALAEMMALLTAAQAEKMTTAFLQQEDDAHYESELDGVLFTARPVRALQAGSVPGGVLLMALGESEFIGLGRNLVVSLYPADAMHASTELVFLDEGEFRGGQWYSLRRLNGDETYHGTALRFDDELRCFRFAVHHMPPAVTG